jgi:hypothetical protein
MILRQESYKHSRDKNYKIIIIVNVKLVEKTFNVQTLSL